MLHVRRAGMVILAVALAAGCRHAANQPVTKAPSNGTAPAAAAPPAKESPAPAKQAPRYDFTFDQGDHLEQLVGAGKYREAAELFADQRAWFNDRRMANYHEPLKRTASALNDAFAPRLDASAKALAAIGASDDAAGWRSARAGVAAAQAVVDEYERIELLKLPDFRAPAANDLRGRLAETKRRFESDAPRLFLAYDHFGASGFFDQYPVPLEAGKFLAAQLPALAPRLEAATPEQLRRFAESAGANGALNDATKAILGDYLMRAHLQQNAAAKPSDLRAMLSAMRAAESAGLKPNPPALKLAFAEVTSRTLLKQGQIDFPAQVDVDLPFSVTKTDFDGALSNSAADAAQLVFVFDVALAKATRRVVGMDKVTSQVITGVKRQLNPAYEAAQLDMNNARNDVNATRNAGSIPDAVEASKARKQYNDARRTLARTPRYIDAPGREDYQFDRARLRATRVMTVHYYVIDRTAGTYFKSTFDVTEEQQFLVAYNLRDKDANRAKHLTESNTEHDLEKWEDAPMTVKLSQLVDHYLANAAQARKLPSHAALREEMLRDKNTALARYEANTFKGTTQTDPRFDSVVAIYTAKSMGSGFFVAPDVVMTNHHVVASGQYVEMKLYGGQETFGRVIASDPHRDLALVRVQTRGKPVKFYSKNALELGTTIDVIGHPRKLEFSITRGIVSAVRPQKSINIPGARNVLTVQTDAAASPGNSGGPWFVRDEVVAVTSWIRVDQGSQNLNFGTHYSEALEFLRENGIQPLI